MISIAPAVITAKTITRKILYQELRKQHITQPFYRLLRSWNRTIGKLKELAVKNPQKFKAYMRLLNSFLALAEKGEVKIELKLYLPSAKALMAIGIEYLLNNVEARKEIFRDCYRPEEGQIDLTRLIRISRKYRPNVAVPTT